MATYYVDTAAAPGGDGSLSTPWDTIADVNAASFSAGDSILFKRGCTWRATLLPPGSGSAGYQITYGAYGTGDDPTINGADELTSWSSTGSVINDNFNDNDISDWTASGGVAAGSERLTCTVADSSGDFCYQVGGPYTDVWMCYKLNINAISWSSATVCVLSGIVKTTPAILNCLYLASTGYFGAYYQNDSGTVTAVSTVAFTTGTDYYVTLHWKAATAPGANNGIVQIWVNGSEVANITNVDNDTLSCDACMMGHWSSDNNHTTTLYYDDVKFSETL